MAEKKKVLKQSSYLIHSEEHARKKFIWEGAVVDSSLNLSSSFIVPFAQTLRATTSQIGFLSASSGLLAPLGSLWGNNLMRKESRKKILLIHTLFESLVLFSMFSLIYLFWNNLLVPYLPYLLIVIYTLLTFSASVKNPPFFSWIGDLVSPNERGKYFSTRNKITGLCGLFSFLLGGLILRYFEKMEYALIGYAVLFSLALILKIISFYQIKGIFSPKFRTNKRDGFSLFSFVKRYDTMGKFAVFYGLFNFSIMIASPFFATYMLKDLHFNLLTFTFVSLSTTVFYLLLTPLAGRVSDKYGNLKLLYIAGFAFPLTPILWIFIEDPIFLIFIPGFISGLANAALTIGSTNYIYDGVSPEKRGTVIAYISILNGIGIFFGSIAGGLMIDYLPITFVSTTFFVFGFAAVMRSVVALLFLPKLQELRKTERVEGLSVDFHHPFKMVSSDIVWFKNFVHGR